MLYLRTKRIINNIFHNKSSAYTINLFGDYNLNFKKTKKSDLVQPKIRLFCVNQSHTYT